MRVPAMIAFLALFSVPFSAARADGLIYRLPKDGTSVRFQSKGSFEGNGRTAEFDGTMSMSSVGKETVGGEECRWIEFQMVANQDGRPRVALFKLLIPEKQLTAGKSPASHVKKMWFRQGNRRVREITDLSDPEAFLLPAFLAGPFEDVKKLDATTVNCGLGKLECEGVTGVTAFDQRSGEFEVTFTNRLNDKAPFGVVASEMKVKESRKGQQISSGTWTFSAIEVGKDAVAAISNGLLPEGISRSGRSTSGGTIQTEPAADPGTVAISPGDTVVVTNDDTQLKVRGTVLAKISKGQRLKVEKVQDSWVWTAFDKDGERTKGWVNVRDVVVQERYKQFLNSMVISRFSTTGPLGWNGLSLRLDGSVLVVNEWGDEPKGLYWARHGDKWNPPNAFSVDPLYTDPENAVELSQGIYVTNNGGRGKVLFVPNDGGPPSPLTTSGITNPFGITIAPPGFEGPEVKPGDLIVFDNGHGNRTRWGVWAVDPETGDARRFAHGQDLPNGFLSGSFGPDGILYAGLNDDRRDGATIVMVSSTGSVDVLLENFAPAGIGHKDSAFVVTNPVTGEIFFSTGGNIYSFNPGERLPRLIVGGGYEVGHWSQNGASLFVRRRGSGVWTLEDPTYVPTAAATSSVAAEVSSNQSGDITSDSLPQ